MPPNKRLPPAPLRSNDPTVRSKINVFRAPYNGPPVVLEMPIDVAEAVLEALREVQAARAKASITATNNFVQETIDALAPYVERP